MGFLTHEKIEDDKRYRYFKILGPVISVKILLVKSVEFGLNSHCQYNFTGRCTLFWTNK